MFAGPSGPLYRETTWENVTRNSGYKDQLTELTTVTGKVRRVGAFDMDAVVRAARLNGATEIALTFADYLDSFCPGEGDTLSETVVKFIERLEQSVDIPVTIVSTGPNTSDTIVRGQ